MDGERAASLLDGNNDFTGAESAGADRAVAEQSLLNSANNQAVSLFGKALEADVDTTENADRATNNPASASTNSRGFPFLDPDTQAPVGNALLLSADNATPISLEQAEGLRANEENSTEFWGNGDTLANVDFGEATASVATEHPASNGQADEERVPGTPNHLAFAAQDYGDAFTEAELAELTGDPSSVLDEAPNPLDTDDLDPLAEADLTEAELAELARAKQPLPLSKAAVAIALLACAALSGLGGLYLFRNQWLPQSQSNDVASPEGAASPDAAASPAVTTSPETASPTPNPQPSSAPSPVSNNTAAKPPLGTPAKPFHAAVNQAIEAANLTQFATTQTDWQTVADRWQNAIAFLEAVPEENPNYATAQEKIVEYQKNLNYAQQKLAAVKP